MIAIASFLVIHWSLAIFCQTFFLHRYATHRMFTMSRVTERWFYLLTALSQGSSYLLPRPYAILHREHHAYSDTQRDPHSPHVYQNLGRMMWNTKVRYDGLGKRTIAAEPRFETNSIEWPLVDRIFDHWVSRLAFGTGYTLFYIAFAPHWAYFLLLPVHYIMGPIHGAIVNWFGHKVGYRNFETPHGDKSRNTLPFDFITWGELFQNNHHARAMSPNFARRWFEIDPTWPIIRVLAWLRIIQWNKPESDAKVPVASGAPLPAVT